MMHRHCEGKLCLHLRSSAVYNHGHPRRLKYLNQALWKPQNTTYKDKSELTGQANSKGCDIQTCLTCSCSRLTTGSISPRWRCLSGRLSLNAGSTQFGKYTLSLCTFPIIDHSLHMLLEHGWQPDCHRVNLKQGQLLDCKMALFLQVSLPTHSMHSSSSSYMPHVPPILSSLIWSP